MGMIQTLPYQIVADDDRAAWHELDRVTIDHPPDGTYLAEARILVADASDNQPPSASLNGIGEVSVRQLYAGYYGTLVPSRPLEVTSYFCGFLHATIEARIVSLEDAPGYQPLSGQPGPRTLVLQVRGGVGDATRWGTDGLRVTALEPPEL